MFFTECAVAVVKQQHAVAKFVDDVEVGPAVVVGVEPDGVNVDRWPARRRSRR